MVQLKGIKSVAKGFTQTLYIDYLETFIPVVKMTTVIMLLSISQPFYMETLMKRSTRSSHKALIPLIKEQSASCKNPFMDRSKQVVSGIQN